MGPLLIGKSKNSISNFKNSYLQGHESAGWPVEINKLAGSGPNFLPLPCKTFKPSSPIP